ncbi:PDZ domain-containing protein 8 [Uranotaenia lowii]|uniref:PDZ domain-containing protein 8 n=1 Tax=Uranotaenia lowii TaxID=190385 RepID=UPI00247AB6FA|nr:PDZ domain-containing protein 8 [Uranotaenia lowii]XP_055609095.1 PDZ domain-containing protein 8 [Uranotaenia lowii]XP_055609096.1 PDZ domain-containing protein 8 [Uranotaenia lowii]XP_055609097.1 PDZ domain-containing protein 8 [Uranotaenia lowii]
MDLASQMLFCLISCVIGAVLMLILQAYVFVRYFRFSEQTDDDQQQEQCKKSAYSEPYVLPDTLLSNIKAPDAESKSTIMAINLIQQFLYFELRNSNRVRKWFHRKLSLELDELISKTTIGKLFDKLSIRDLDLGSQFPEIKNFRLHNCELHPDEGHIESLDVLLDLHYEGNFRLSIDADMVLCKKGFLSVKVRQVSGIARLQFTRKPYTHWSLSFIGDPKVDLEVQSQFQGRQIQSNVSSLISNQIRKAIRRKHTLPNYKLRYKPFFHRVEEDYDLNEITPNGTLEVIVEEITRLNSPNRLSHVYCTLTLAHMPWVLARQQDDANLIVSLDLEIHKAKNQQIGIVFKQTDQLILIEAVIPNTPASKAELKRGDVLLSIQGKKVTTINQVAKIIKALNRPMFILRIERIIPGVIRNDGLLEDLEEYEEIDPNLNISFTKSAENVQIGSTIAREKTRLSRRSSRDSGGESSHSNTPGTTPVKRLDSSKDVRKEEPSTSKGSSIEGSSSRKSLTDSTYPQHSSVDCEFNSFIRMEDLCNFQLLENFTYLNVNVFGKSSEDHRLLGYLNIPIQNVMMECNESHLGHYLKKYPLLPPEAIDVSNHPLSMQSGFDQNYCYGDILLSFVWNGSLINGSLSAKSSSESVKKLKLISISKGSVDKLDELDKSESSAESKSVSQISSQVPMPQPHDFIRTHFHRTTQCDYCGKKIWLKDAVQCRDCAMCCHKKCINKCQSSTICNVGDSIQSTSSTSSMQPEFRVTEVESPTIEIEDFVDIAEEHQLQQQQQQQAKSRLDSHRQSFSDLLAQGLKRVNSASNLSIPMVSSNNQSSKSLPPTPQHTPRKQSLANVSTNPFTSVTQKLENLPEDVKELHIDQIIDLTAPIVEYGSSDTLMALAKSSSKILYAECEPDVRTEKINKLLSKLHIALDCETLNQSSLSTAKESSIKGDDGKPKTNGTPSSSSDATRSAFLAGQSEERVQALSIIMLHLCSGLQHVQGSIPSPWEKELFQRMHDGLARESFF